MILAEPDALLTGRRRCPALTGTKMSKSYGNTISCVKRRNPLPRRFAPCRPILREAHRSGRSGQMSGMAVPPDLQRRCDPRGCRRAAEARGSAAWTAKQPVLKRFSRNRPTCRSALSPTWKIPSLVRNIIADGGERARKLAQETMRDVREAMGLDYG